MNHLPALCLGLALCFASHASAHALEPHGTRAPVATPSSADNIERGSLGYQLLGGGIGLVLGAGVTWAVMAQHSDCTPDNHLPSPCAMEASNAMLTHVLFTTPLLITGGVILGGNATGSNGRFFSTWGGTMLGVLAGLFVTLPFANEDASYEARLASLPVVGITAVGGGILFYRNSASAPRVTVAPTANGRGAMFTLQGSM